ncbi:L-glutamate gamma-semialdehyde dehydrogenase [Effusibacillus pohliae]|uniref:L-glutamate gamma-semialdehyde dehydrogenase n=1 Tax=Effusibacillus pohliae TaxID=232270 RepID=UPI000364C951|nr:L-glutamate gamma-semialdehyde dehydrogenase [Effusibacillus pohliae]
MIEFRNEPFTDFADPANRQAMEAALAKVKAEFGKVYPLVIGREKMFTDKRDQSVNPGNLDEVVGIQSQADKKLVDQAIQVALETFKTWQHVDPHTRAGYLFKAAAVMRRRKFEFAAWIVYEAGKNWAEADADVAEAIDFLEFYGREMIRLGGPQPLVPLPGEDNRLYYIPLGVGLIIPPWNFPLAIMAGMTVSAIVTGNTVLLKPASQTPIIAAKFVELMEEIGLPPGVINYVPGDPAEIGDFMVEHPKTRFISFTGSRDTGLRINERAAKAAQGQIWIKRLVAEMGGKDAVVVDASADLEEAAIGIVQSAFGFQGQKCSAGSRAIIHKDVYDEVLAKVVEKTKQLRIGLPEQNYPVGPVIDQKAFNKIMSYIEIGQGEGRLMLGGGRAEGNGWYIEPTIFADVKEDARIMRDEIFGPVVAFCKADSFEHAVDIFNNTEYGLTGSLYTNNREHLEYARRHMHCGNLYFNRKCTGALVGVHPFGGFNMSGTDSKAGGRDYLLWFMQAKVVSERF